MFLWSLFGDNRFCFAYSFSHRFAHASSLSPRLFDKFRGFTSLAGMLGLLTFAVVFVSVVFVFAFMAFIDARGATIAFIAMARCDGSGDSCPHK